VKVGHALAALVLLAVAGLQASCVAVLGIEEEPVDAVAKLCGCVAEDYPGGKPSCITTLTGRLNNATETTRAEWLGRYIDQCAKCGDAWKCIQASPTCSDNACDSSLQCCSRNGLKATCNVLERTCSK
jgi:hypothetical protein